MALSKNVVINFLTKFDPKGLDKAAKDLKGFDRFVARSEIRLRRGLKVGAVTAGFALLKLGKDSIQAALSQEKLDNALKQTLKSIGQAGLLPETKDFVNELQRATNVTEDALVPALQQLIAQTGNLDSSQALLKTALDVSAGTGKDLSEVLDAITKAAVGNYKSIGALGVGFSAADAKAMGFVGTMQALDKYQGAAEASTQTLEGQIKSLKISAGETTESLGIGFLTAASYIASGTENLRLFGFELEKLGAGIGDTLAGFGKVVSEKGWLKALNTTFDDLGREGFKIRQKQYMQAKGYLGLSQQTIDAMELQNKYGKKQLTYDEMLKKIQADILAKNKLTTKEKSAQADLDKQRASIQKMFDLDAINLQAALTRKLSFEDEARVKILQKLSEGTKEATDEAQKYLDVLQVIADGKIDNGEIEMLAKKWKMTVPEVLLYLKVLFDSNAELQKMLNLLNQVNQTKIQPLAQPATMFTPTASNTQMSKLSQASQEIVQTVAGMSESEIQQKYISPTQAEIYLAKQAIDKYGLSPRYAGMLLGSVALADGGIVTQPTLATIGESGAEAVIPLDKMGSMGTTIQVNVAGSVISEGQLQSVIQDALYNLNRSGAVSQLTNLGR